MPRQTFHSGPPPRFGTAGRPARPIPRAPSHPLVHPVGVLPAVQSLLYVLVVALFLMTFTAQPIRIPSSSMEPTLLVGDFLLLDKQSVASDARGLFPPTAIRRGDVIVFHDPVEDSSLHLVKRVIALPGDRLHLRSGVVFLNGQRLSEPYAIHRPAPADTFRDNFPSLQSRDAGVDPDWWIRLRTLVHAGDITVPPQSYFVMGDNRNDSEDSRYWGFVPRDAIVGKPLLIYFSYRDPTGVPRAHTHPESWGQSLVDTLSNFARPGRTFRIIH